jgi:hypothetical protein
MKMNIAHLGWSRERPAATVTRRENGWCGEALAPDADRSGSDIRKTSERAAEEEGFTRRGEGVRASGEFL